MATPTLKAVPVTGPAPGFAEPVEIYGLPEGGGAPASFSEITGTVANSTGGNLQLILNDIAARLKNIEDAST